MTFFTDAFSDGVLLQVGHAFERLAATREKGPQPFNPPKTELYDVRLMSKD
jgi:amidase